MSSLCRGCPRAQSHDAGEEEAGVYCGKSRDTLAANAAQLDLPINSCCLLYSIHTGGGAGGGKDSPRLDLLATLPRDLAHNVARLPRDLMQVRACLNLGGVETHSAP